jgi:hypothetical protein
MRFVQNSKATTNNDTPENRLKKSEDPSPARSINMVTKPFIDPAAVTSSEPIPHSDVDPTQALFCRQSRVTQSPPAAAKERKTCGQHNEKNMDVGIYSVYICTADMFACLGS